MGWGLVTMRRTRSIFVSVSLLGGVFLVSHGPAAAQATAVGGGAAGVQISAFQGTEPANPLRGAFAQAAYPQVTLPPEGSPLLTREAGDESGVVVTSPLIDSAVLQIAKARVTTEGNLQGSPYAESRAAVGYVRIGKLPIMSVQTHCRWDTTGVSATTSLTLANGENIAPPPNTTIPISGIGSVVVNQQFRETLSDGSEVIYVSGIHLALNPKAAAAAATPTTVEVDIALSSCDPNKLPFATGGGLLLSTGPETGGVI